MSKRFIFFISFLSFFSTQAHSSAELSPALTLVGELTQLNGIDEGAQINPSTATLLDGQFVTVWADRAGADGSEGGIFGQIYNEDMTPVADAFQVNTITNSWQSKARIASAPNGRFLVIWNHFSQLKAQFYDAQGTPDGEEFLITPNSGGGSVWSDAQGHFWVRNNVTIYKYANSGELLSETVIDDGFTGLGITILADERFLVYGRTDDTSVHGSTITAQYYTNELVATGEKFVLQSLPSGVQSGFNVTALVDGGYVLTWQSLSDSSSGWDVYAQQFDASDVGQGIFEVNAVTSGMQIKPDVHALTDGGYVIVWKSTGVLSGVFAQVYDASGSEQGSARNLITGSGANPVVNLMDGSFDVKIVTLSPSNYLLTFGGNKGGNNIFGQKFSYTRGSGVDTDEDGYVDSVDNCSAILNETQLDTDGDGIGDICDDDDDGDGVNDDVDAFPLDVTETTDVDKDGVGDNRDYDVDGDGEVDRLVATAPFASQMFKVNSYTPGDQINVSIAPLLNGQFVAIWADRVGFDQFKGGIVGRIYNADMTPTGEDFLINTTRNAWESKARVASNAAGEFMVIWHAERPLNGQLFASDGSRVGGQFNIEGASGYADVTADDLGNFWVVTEGGKLNKYAPDGTHLLDSLEVSTLAGPRLSALVGGGVMLVGRQTVDDRTAVYIERIASDGTNVSELSLVDELSQRAQSHSSVSRAGDRHVVLWQSEDENGTFVYGRVYDASGTGGTVFKVTSEDETASLPVVSGASNGSFVLSWDSVRTEDSGLYIREYDRDLNTTIAPIYVASGKGAEITHVTDDNILLAWDGWAGNRDIYARLLTFSNDDYDQDGILDTADAYSLIAIGDLLDTDSDGAPDTCDEACIELGMLADTDDDNDGVLDTADAYPLVAIGDLDDTDVDGAPDTCDETCVELGMAADEDDDNDGIADTSDEYPLISIGNLTDTDSDGVPDTCDEACVELGMAADTDDDNDGVLDTADAYPLVAIGDLVDTDSDGAPDTCDEACVELGMLADTDDDNDGINDDDDFLPLDATETLDTDSDDVGNNQDTDDDNDGVLDTADVYPLISIGDLLDTDSDGAPNTCDEACLELGMAADTDDDNDGLLDTADPYPVGDIDGFQFTDSIIEACLIDTARKNDWINISDFTSLNCNSVQNVDDLSLFSYLETLNLSFDEQSDVDLSALSSLENLKSLNMLNAKSLTDLSPIGNLEKLTGLLIVWVENVEEYEFLSKLINLNSLTLVNANGVADELHVLSALTNLTNLGIYDSGLTTIGEIKNLKKLSFLGLAVNRITDLSGIEELDNLTYLVLSLNRLRHFNQIQNLSPNLTINSYSEPLLPVKCNEFLLTSNNNILVSEIPDSCILVDVDNDLIDDQFEISYDLDPQDSTDALMDLDNDGFNNLDEYYAGTSPADRNDYPKRLTDLTIDHPGFSSCISSQYQAQGIEFNTDLIKLTCNDISQDYIVDLTNFRNVSEIRFSGSHLDLNNLTTDSVINAPLYNLVLEDFSKLTPRQDDKKISVSTLLVSGSNLNNFNFLSSFSDVKELNVFDLNIDRLQGLERLESLEKLTISGQVKDLYMIKYLIDNGLSQVDLRGLINVPDECADMFIEQALPTVCYIENYGNFENTSILIDTDQDGVYDFKDAFPNNASEVFDSDEDGLGDNYEIANGLDRKNSDSDFDSISDGTEIQQGTNPILSDSDSDGVLDAEDAFPTDSSEFIDTDLDTIGNRKDTDDDNDGVLDTADAYPLIAIGDLDDTDVDGAPDTCDEACVELGMAADTDDDNDGIADTSDAYPLISIGNLADTDSDGVPDTCNEACVKLGMAADADDDNDGVPDEEDVFPQDGTKTTLLDDETAPVVIAPADIYVDAAGELTAVDVGLAEVEDNLEVLVAVADKQSPFASGETVVTWSAVDSAGNVGTAVQRIFIQPYVEIAANARMGQGDSLSVPVTLSGASYSYPVLIPVSVDVEGVSLSTSEIEIRSGMSAILDVTLPVSESLLASSFDITLDTPTNAVLGANKVMQVAIVEDAAPPKVSLVVTQDDVLGRYITQTDSDVAIEVFIDDVNGNHAIGWDVAPGLTDIIDDSAINVIRFNPQALAPGNYLVTVNVADDGLPDQLFTRELTLKVSGFSKLLDADDDGIPDDVDITLASNAIQLSQSSTDIVQANAGVKLILGNTAADNDEKGIAVDETDLPVADALLAYPLGLLDFEAQLNVPGETLELVVPLSQGIPDNAIYRKLIDGRWRDFVSGDGNGIASALVNDDGVCPLASSDTYQAGLTAGDTCLRLTIVDGGPNDADGQINGHVVDPGGIAIVDEDAGIPAYTYLEQPEPQFATLTPTAKVIVTGSQGDNFFDIARYVNDVSLVGQSFLVSGSGSVDGFMVMPGVKYDLANLKGGVDAIYFSGPFAEYADSILLDPGSGVMQLSRLTDIGEEIVQFIATASAADVLVFTDGAISTSAIKDAIINETSMDDLVLDSSVSALDTKPISGGTVKHIVLDNNGAGVMALGPNISTLISGSSGIDHIYVPAGSVVDASNLKSGQDEIYLEGALADYSLTLDNSGNITLTRDITVNDEDVTERVTVASGGNVATNDLVIFADQQLPTQSLKQQYLN